MTPTAIIQKFLAYAGKLKFRNLFLIVISLFFIDLVVPDFIPLIDEIMLGLLAIILANWKEDRRGVEKTGSVIEGEIVDDDEQPNP